MTSTNSTPAEVTGEARGDVALLVEALDAAGSAEEALRWIAAADLTPAGRRWITAALPVLEVVRPREHSTLS